jgi:hypothetical protein
MGKISLVAWHRVHDGLLRWCSNLGVTHIRMWWDQALAIKRPETQAPGMWTMCGLLPYAMLQPYMHTILKTLHKKPSTTGSVTGSGSKWKHHWLQPVLV